MPDVSGLIHHAGYFWLTSRPGPGTVVNVSSDPAPTTWGEYARALGLNLQRRRLAAGLTQEDLAHRAGLTRTHYQQIERGYWKPGQPANPSIRVLVGLAQQLQVSVGELVPRVDRLERWA